MPAEATLKKPVESESVAIIPIQPQPPAPTFEMLFPEPEKALAHAEKVAKALHKFLKRKKTKVQFNGKDYPCNEDWQFVGAFFGHTPREDWVKPIREPDEEGTERIIGYLSRVEVVNSQGRVVSAAEAACLRSERNWQSKPDFQLLSMAQTRASSKALANVFRWVMVLAGLQGTPAEEMVADQPILPTGVCHDCEEDVFESGAYAAKSKLVFGKLICRKCAKTAKKLAQKETDELTAALEKSVEIATTAKAEGIPIDWDGDNITRSKK